MLARTCRPTHASWPPARSSTRSSRGDRVCPRSGSRAASGAGLASRTCLSRRARAPPLLPLHGDRRSRGVSRQHACSRARSATAFPRRSCSARWPVPAGIPARLGFCDVKNHLTSEKLLRVLKGVDLFVWHGYVELHIDGRAIKVTPAFNAALCARFGVPPLEGRSGRARRRAAPGLRRAGTPSHGVRARARALLRPAARRDPAVLPRDLLLGGCSLAAFATRPPRVAGGARPGRCCPSQRLQAQRSA